MPQPEPAGKAWGADSRGLPRLAGARRATAAGAAAGWALFTTAYWATAAGAISVNPAAPPGTQKLQTILNYGGWMVTFLCAGGFLAVAGTMALQHRRGEGGEHVGKLGMVMGAAVLGTAAGPIITVLT